MSEATNGNKAAGGVSSWLARMVAKPIWVGLFVLAMLYLALVLLLATTLSPERYNLSVGDIAPKTITATKDVIDELSTQLAREAAARNVQAVYMEEEDALAQVEEQLIYLFGEFEDVRQFGEDLRYGRIQSESDEADAFWQTNAYPASYAKEDLQRAASMTTQLSLSEWQLTTLMNLSESTLQAVLSSTRSAVENAMQSTIREGQVENAITNIQRQIITNISSDLTWNIAIPAVRACLRPNMVVNQEATETERERARSAVEPVYYKSGQNIVIEGERVTMQQITVLTALGLLEGNVYDVTMYGGAGLLVALLLLSMSLYLFQFARDTLREPKTLLLLALCFIVTVLLSMIVQTIHPYLAPVTLCALLVAVLISPRVSIAVSLLTSVVAGILLSGGSNPFSQQMVTITTSGFLAGAVGIFTVRSRQSRVITLLAGLLMALTGLAVVFAIGLLTNNNLRGVLDNALWAMGAGLLSSVLCVGLQPALEWMFNLVTSAKLLELANPNQPLLRRLLVETPGTYNHCIMVGNIGEAAAEAVGANPLLVRVGAYFHDIGKLKRPLYFKENQLGENPHDHTDPRVSTAIVIAHVKDGVALAQRHRLPVPVIDMIQQHHGTTPALFFYHKAKSVPGNENLDLADFRYEGPRPQTKEAAILMLADTVEAAIRSMHDQSPEKIEQTIRSLVKGKLDDGQLDESPLNYSDVNKICRAFTLAMTGVHHQRIEYPNVDIRGEAPVVDSGVYAYPHQKRSVAQAQQAEETAGKADGAAPDEVPSGEGAAPVGAPSPAAGQARKPRAAPEKGAPRT